MRSALYGHDVDFERRLQTRVFPVQGSFFGRYCKLEAETWVGEAEPRRKGFGWSDLFNLKTGSLPHPEVLISSLLAENSTVYAAHIP